MNIFGFRPFKGRFNLGNSEDIPTNTDGTLIGAVKKINNNLSAKIGTESGSVGSYTTQSVEKISYDNTNQQLILKVNGADTPVPFSSGELNELQCYFAGAGTAPQTRSVTITKNCKAKMYDVVIGWVGTTNISTASISGTAIKSQSSSVVGSVSPNQEAYVRFTKWNLELQPGTFTITTVHMSPIQHHCIALVSD